MQVSSRLLLTACRLGIVWAALASGPLANAYWPDREDWPIREEETVTRSLRLAGEPMRLVVENVDGYVHVTAGSGEAVHVKAHKTIRAESASDLTEAKRDVKLSFAEEPGRVDISYDAPWVCRGETGGCHGQHRHFYKVTYDIDVEAPASSRAVISTVNNGDISIAGTSGDFEVSDINGGISMTRISGSGQIRTINGPVAVEFARNPQRSTSFSSINGALNVTFQPGLSADLLFKTMNGEIFTDFDVAPRSISAVQQEERRNGRFVYRSNGLKGARVGQGGPGLSFNTLNGSIYLRRAK